MENKIKQMRAEWALGDIKRDAELSIPEDVTRYLDLPYGEAPMQVLDVYCPKGTDRPLPTIINFHGGGWFYGSKETYSHYCMKLAQRGFTIVNFSYRLAPEHKYPAAVEDCCKALHWVKNHGTEYFVDLNNLFTVGDSAGGQLSFQVLTMMTSRKYAKLFPFSPPEDLTIRACGLNCGCYFMPVGKFLPPEKTGILFQAYFPEDYLSIVREMKTHKYVTKHFPPAFITTSQNDYLKLMAPPLLAVLKLHGVESRLKIYGTKEQKEIGHVFHLNCRSELADLCNDEQCAFFRAHIQ